MKPRMRFLGYCPKCGKDVAADFCDECGAFTQEPVEEDECHSTRTGVRKDTNGKKYERSQAQKSRKTSVQRARQRKMDALSTDTRYPPK